MTHSKAVWKQTTLEQEGETNALEVEVKFY